MVQSEEARMEKLAQLLRRLEMIENNPATEVAGARPSSPAIQEPDSSSSELKPERLRDRLEAVLPQASPDIAEDPALNDSSAMPASPNIAAMSSAPQVAPARTTRVSSTTEKSFLSETMRPSRSSGSEMGANKGAGNAALVVLSVSFAALVSMAVTLMFALGHFGALPKVGPITLSWWGAQSKSSEATVQHAPAQAVATHVLDEAARKAAAPTPATAGAIANPSLPIASPVDASYTPAPPLQNAAMSALPAQAGKPHVIVPPDWVVPFGASIQLPVIQAGGDQTASQLLIFGLEPGASMRDGIEIVAGTWLVESDKVSVAQLSRGATAPARVPLLIEVRSAAGTAIEQHHVNLLTSNGSRN